MLPSYSAVIQSTMKKTLLLLSVATALLLLLLPPTAEGGRLLFWMPVVSESMKICFMPLAEELVKKGHQVTIVMPIKLKKEIKGIEVITAENSVGELHLSMSKEMLREGGSPAIPIGQFISMATETNAKALRDPALQKYLKGDPRGKFDVVLVSVFFASETGYYLAHKFDASLALYFTGQMSISFTDYAMGQPHNPSYLPLFLLGYHHPMTFLQRVLNTVATLAVQHLGRDYYIMSRLEAVLDEAFPEDKERPPLLEIEKNTSLALHYGHPMLMDGMRPVMPNFQYLGMMNCQGAQPLPKDLEDFMQSGNDEGVIYVSFGSVIKASEMSDKKLQMFLRAFGKLKQKILWKWEKESMPGQPANVKLMKWLPQQDILGHKNTRLFVTHGGQSSFQECLCHQKPAMFIPVTGDQPQNGAEAERMGWGISIKFHDVTEENLVSSINKLLQDPSYAAVAKEKGALLTDQETKPLDRAVWWLEFLMRHPKHLHPRSPVHDLRTHEFLLLDVFAFLAAVFLLLAYVVVKMVRCCCCRGAGKEKVSSAAEFKHKYQQRKKKD